MNKFAFNSIFLVCVFFVLICASVSNAQEFGNRLDYKTEIAPVIGVFLPLEGDLDTGVLYGFRILYGPEDNSEYAELSFQLGVNNINVQNTIFLNSNTETGEITSTFKFVSSLTSRTTAVSEASKNSLLTLGSSQRLGKESSLADLWIIKILFS